MGDFSIFAMRIKELRTSLNMTQRDFAGFIGCTAATLSAYENGAKSPSLEIVKSIAQKCNVSIDWLCGLSEKTNDEDNIKTYADLIRILLKIQTLDLVPTKFDLRAEEVYNSFTNKYDLKAGVLIEDEKIYRIIQDIQKMQNVLNDNTINQDIYNTWLDGFLEKYNTPLITWDSISFEKDAVESSMNTATKSYEDEYIHFKAGRKDLKALNEMLHETHGRIAKKINSPREAEQ